MKDINCVVLLNILILICNIIFCTIISFGLNYFLDTPFTFANIVLFIITLSVIQLSIMNIVGVNRH